MKEEKFTYQVKQLATREDWEKARWKESAHLKSPRLAKKKQLKKGIKEA